MNTIVHVMIQGQQAESAGTERVSKVKSTGWTSGRDLLTQLRGFAGSAVRELARPEIRSSLAEAVVAGVVILFATMALTERKREVARSRRS